MKSIYTITFLLSVFIFKINLSPDEIQGKWNMYKVIQDAKDVTAEHNPNKDRYVIFNKDNTFESGGKPFGKNTGKYDFNLNDKTLFLDSDAGQEDDSYWKVTFKSDTMYWQGYGSEWAKDFVLIHIKEK